MSPRRLGYLFALFALVSSGAYVFIYLYRWEWNRALIAGVLFIATEVGLLGALILDRLRGIERRLDEVTSRHSQALARDVALGHLQATAPPPRDHFAWLKPRPDEGTFNVFVPVLMGAGVVLSALAWLVERVARATARPVLEQGLARRLGCLALPAQGFIDADPDGIGLLLRPSPRELP